MPDSVLHIGAEAPAADFLAAYVRSPHVNRVVLAAGGEAGLDLRERFGIIRELADDPHRALGETDIALVSVSVPLREQPGVAMAAMRAGKDVLCPAPLAETVTEADEMIRVADVMGRRLLCALHEPILPAVVKAKALVDSREFAAPTFMSVLSLQPEPPKSLLAALVQPIGLLQHLLGPAHAATATAGAAATLVNLEFAGSVMGGVTFCHGAAADRASCERRLVGEQGSLLIRDDPEDEWPLIFLSADEFHPLKVKNPPDVQAWARREMVVHLVDCLRTGAEPLVSLAAVRQALATAVAALESAREGCRVELLPEPPVISI